MHVPRENEKSENCAEIRWACFYLLHNQLPWLWFIDLCHRYKVRIIAQVVIFGHNLGYDLMSTAAEHVLLYWLVELRALIYNNISKTGNKNSST